MTKAVRKASRGAKARPAREGASAVAADGPAADPKDALPDIADSVGHSLIRVSALLLRSLTRIMRRFNLSLAQFTALRAIIKNPGISQSDLAESMRIDPSRAVLIVDALEGLGLATRSPSANDRRIWVLESTAEGRALIAQMEEASWEHERSLVSDLERGESARLIAILNKLNVDS